MFRTRTHDQFVDEFNERRDDANEYTFESEYIASNADIKVKHLLCDTVFVTTPVKLTRSRSPIRCAECSPTLVHKKTTEEIAKEVKRYGDGHFELIADDHKNGLHYLTVRHHVCGYAFYIYRNNMLTYGLSCAQCNQTESKRTAPIKRHEEMAERIALMSNNTYKLTSAYKGYAQPVTVKHAKTGKEETITYSGLIQRIKKEFPDNIKASKLRKEQKQKQIETRILEESFGRYELKSKYQGYDKHVAVYDRSTGKTDRITYSSLYTRIKKLNNQHQACRDAYANGRPDYPTEG